VALPEQAPPDLLAEAGMAEAEPLAEPLPPSSGEVEETWMTEMESVQETDMSMFETKPSAETVEAEMAAQTMEAAEEAPAEEAAPVTASSGGVSESFEDAFAALKEEIESNPEGERLDDVLRMEQLQEEVAKIEFTIPQHEHALARGMPLYALPAPAPVAAPAAPAGVRAPAAAAKPQRAAPPAAAAAGATRRTVEETRASSTVTTTVTVKSAATGTAGVAESTRRDLGLAATGSLLDDSARARLGQILDEIISTSVRKAVREEMPRLMERIAKESAPPSA